jgi:hypothetical protein
MSPTIEDLSAFGKARLDDDFQACDRRGRRASRIDFAEGWMAMAIRYHLWSVFTREARDRLESPQG